MYLSLFFESWNKSFWLTHGGCAADRTRFIRFVECYTQRRESGIQVLVYKFWDIKVLELKIGM